MDTKKLRLIQRGYEKLTGEIGGYQFKDGVSVLELPRNERDRIAAAFRCEEIDKDGNVESAGPSARLIAKVKMAQATEPLKRATQEEIDTERLALIMKNEKQVTIRTKGLLEKILERKGVNGLRDIGNEWGVEDGVATVLIDKILTKQKRYVDGRRMALSKLGVDDETLDAFFKAKDARGRKKAEPKQDAPAKEPAANMKAGADAAKASAENAEASAGSASKAAASATSAETAQSGAQTSATASETPQSIAEAAASGDVAAAVSSEDKKED